MLLTNPCVFAAGDTYQIFVPVKKESVMWIKIGDECYFDESNGVLRSLSRVHKITVPMKALDEAKKYTVCNTEIKGRRKAYFNKMHKTQEYEYDFRPVEGDEIRAYHIADSHNRVDEPIKAAETFGNMDFLILNGDVPNDCGNIKYFNSIYEIVGKITGGNIPAIFVRGNHDIRGSYAEVFSDYIPTVDGNTYFTFRLGNIWGVALDCGEDKPDTNPEYGGTICCHAFRKRETSFIEKVADCECHKDESIMKKLVVAHNPFTMRYNAPFNIEEDIYTYWAKIIKEKIQPDVMICGHLHKTGVHPVGGKLDAFGQPCTMVIGSKPDKNYYMGVGFIFGKNSTKVIFTDSNGISEEEITI